MLPIYEARLHVESDITPNGLSQVLVATVGTALTQEVLAGTARHADQFPGALHDDEVETDWALTL